MQVLMSFGEAVITFREVTHSVELQEDGIHLGLKSPLHNRLGEPEALFAAFFIGTFVASATNRTRAPQRSNKSGHLTAPSLTAAGWAALAVIVNQTFTRLL